jgi:ankyrin repeat protein
MQPIRNQSSSSYGSRAVDPSDLKPQNANGDISLHLLVKHRDYDGLIGRITNSGRQGSDLREMVNYQNHQGDTPLHYAVQLDSNIKEYICEKLLNYGADPNIKNKAGKVPGQLASQHPVLKLLSEHGCRIAAQKLNESARIARIKQEQEAAHKAHFNSWQYYGN